MDAKQACDKLNGFNFQSRYLVGASTLNIFRQDISTSHVDTSNPWGHRHVHILADMPASQYYITSPRRWSSQKRTLRLAASL